MTPKEIRAEILAIQKEVGPHASLFVSISHYYGDKPIDAGLYPEGMSRDSAFRANADDWPELFKTIRSKWAEISERHRKQAIRKMALEIIRRTAEDGVCTDAMLRGEFSNEEVEAYGAEAVEDANEIASNGPFSITKLVGANAA